MKEENDLYKRLGVESDANKDEIKKAYRKRARQTHPDVNEGKDEEFKKVNEAYLILSDEGKRKRYDDGESAESISQDRPDRVQGELAGLFIVTVQKSTDVKSIDIIREMKKMASIAIVNAKEMMKKIDPQIEKFKEAKSRVSKGKDCLLRHAADAQIRTLTEQKKQLEIEIELMGKVKERIDDYKYVYEQTGDVHFSFGFNPFGPQEPFRGRFGVRTDSERSNDKGDQNESSEQGSV